MRAAARRSSADSGSLRAAHLGDLLRRRDDRAQQVRGGAHATASACDARTIASSVARAAPESMADAATLMPSRDGRDAAGHEQRRAGIEHHDIARRAGLPVQHAAHDRGVLGGIAAEQLAERRLANAELRRVDVERVHGTVAALGHLGVAGRRDLVDAVGAVHDPGARRAEQPQRAREQIGQIGPRHADDLTRRAGGIRQRAEQVERRPHAHLAPRRRRRASSTDGTSARRRTRCCRVVQRALDDRRRRGEVHAELLEHVGAAAAARHRSIAVLGDLDAARRDDDRRRRRDVERARRDRRRCRRCRTPRPSALDSFTACSRIARAKPTISAGRSPFIASADSSAGERRRRGTAFHDLAHGGRGLVGR